MRDLCTKITNKERIIKHARLFNVNIALLYTSHQISHHYETNHTPCWKSHKYTIALHRNKVMMHLKT